MGQSGVIKIQSDMNDLWIFGTGPIQWGSLPDGIEWTGGTFS